MASERATDAAQRATHCRSCSLAKRHLWMHFSRMGAYDGRRASSRSSSRGDGCHVWDEHGNRYFDGLSALFCVNIGHGRADVAQAGAKQAEELGFFTNWSYAHPRSIELADAHRRPHAGRPQPRLLHQQRQRGGRDRDQARPPVPQAHGQPEQDEGHRARDRLPRHDAGRARRDRASRRCARRSSRSCPAAATCRTRTSTGSKPGYGAEMLADAVAERIEFEGPETVAAVIMEPVQNAGGCFTPPEGYFQRVREICDRYDVLMISDEVICSWGRLGDVVRRAALRLPAGHDHDGEGDHLGVRAARRGHRVATRSSSRSPRATRRSCTG